MGNVVKIIGFMVSSGNSKKDNIPFEMNKLYYIRPIEKKDTPNIKVSECSGYTASDYLNKVLQLDIDDNVELLNKLKTAPFPCDAELIFGIRLQNNGRLTQNIVIDINLV